MHAMPNRGFDFGEGVTSQSKNLQTLFVLWSSTRLRGFQLTGKYNWFCQPLDYKIFEETNSRKDLLQDILFQVLGLFSVNILAIYWIDEQLSNFFQDVIKH